MNKRPLCFSLLFFICGILAGQYLSSFYSIALFFALISLVCLGLYLYTGFKPVFFFIITTAVGFALLLSRQVSVLPETNSFKGRVTGVYETSGDSIRVMVKTTENRLLMVYTKNHLVRVGDNVRFTGKAQALSPRRNPGGFDEQMYYQARGVSYKIFAENFEVTGHSPGVSSFLDQSRQRLVAIYDSVLPENESGTIKSIIIGDRSGLPSEVKDLFGDAGIYHILAISGLHLSIISLILNKLLSIFFDQRISGLISILFIVFYCVFTGASPSTMRASIMFAAIILGRWLYREGDLLTSLSLACYIVLFISPFYLWDLGFQYSFGAMLSIGLLSQPLELALYRIGARLTAAKKIINNFWVNKSLCGSAAVIIGSFPIGSYYMPFFLPYSIIVNILLLPTFTLLVIAGLAVGISGLFSTGAATFFAGTVYYLLKIYTAVSEFFTSLPGSRILTGYIPLYFAATYYLFIFAWAYYILNTEPSTKKFKPQILATITFCFALCYHLFFPKPLIVTMLDVSQGDCFVIKKDSFTAIIDGGGYLNREIGENTGTRVLIPYLNYLAANTVDLVFVSHADWDHAAGILELMETKKIGTLCLPSNTNINLETGLYLELLDTARKNNINVQHLEAGDIYQYNDIVFETLHPAADYKASDINDTSLILKLAFKNRSFLFTGDISSEVESQLQTSENLSADVLKLAHHGSKYSNSSAFIESVSPLFSIVSCSANNSYGHPDSNVVQLLTDKNIPLFSTALNGAVILSTNGDTLKVKVSIN